MFAKLDKQFSVFSFEVGRNGERKFLVCHKEIFWKFYKDLGVKNYYEVIPKNEPCKLYFDLEFMNEFNLNKDGHVMTQKLIEIVNLRLSVEFNLKNIPEDVLVLESSSETKFSIHLIFCKTVFSSNDHCGIFVKNMVSTCSEKEKEMFSIKDKNGLVGLFIDQAVYSRNRNFRLFLSAKYGKHVSLQTSPVDLHSITIMETNPTLDNENIQKMIFYASLISNVDKSAEEQLISLTDTDSDTKHSVTTHTIHQACHSDYQTGQASPFTEIDQFVSSLVRPGRIRRWRYNQTSNTILYDIVGSRWCGNVAREHKSNNVYWVCHLDRGVVVQGCQDMDCRGFRGEEVMLPDSAMPWGMMEEWEEEEMDDPGDLEMFDEDDQALLDASMDF